MKKIILFIILCISLEQKIKGMNVEDVERQVVIPYKNKREAMNSFLFSLMHKTKNKKDKEIPWSFSLKKYIIETCEALLRSLYAEK